MRVIDVLTSPWAIMPEKLMEISGIYSTHLRGEKIDIKGIEAKIGRPLENRDQGYEVVNGVAIVPVYGVIAKKMNLFQAISGGASTELLARDFNEAMADESVKAIILDIDSPGGSVDGTEDIAKVIYESRGTKPIVAYANGLMASAAYWLGSAADKIYMANKTTAVGSIGVVATHVDQSGVNEREGIKVTEITAGKYKRIPSENGPLTKEGRAVMQDRVDYIYSVFVEDVAKFKNVSVQTVIDDMADGRVFLGEQAIEAGLVDGISTLEGLIEMLSSDNKILTNGFKAGALKETITIEDNSMNINKAYILENHPEIADAFINEGKASVDVDSIKAEATNAERERIKDVLGYSMPGHEAMVQELAFDGKTTGPEAAAKILMAEKGIKQAKQDAIAEDAAEIPDVEPGEPAAINNRNLSVEERCVLAWDKDENLQAEFNGNFNAYVAYEKNFASGNVKVLSKTK